MSCPLQKVLEGLVIGDDAIVHDNKLMFVVRYLRMAVEDGWLTMCGPSRVCNASMTVEVGVQVDITAPELCVRLVHQGIDFAWRLDDYRSACVCARAVLNHARTLLNSAVGRAICYNTPSN